MRLMRVAWAGAMAWNNTRAACAASAPRDGQRRYPPREMRAWRRSGPRHQVPHASRLLSGATACRLTVWVMIGLASVTRGARAGRHPVRSGRRFDAGRRMTGSASGGIYVPAARTSDVRPDNKRNWRDGRALGRARERNSLADGPDRGAHGTTARESRCQRADSRQSTTSSPHSASGDARR